MSEENKKFEQEKDEVQELDQEYVELQLFGLNPPPPPPTTCGNPVILPISRRGEWKSYCIKDKVIDGVCRDLNPIVFAKICVGTQAFVYQLATANGDRPCEIKVTGFLYYKPNCNFTPQVVIYVVYPNDCSC